MKTINLARQDYNEIGYRIHYFPDGQLQLEITDCLCNFKDELKVVSRLCHGNDLFILLQLDDILKRNGIKYKLIIPYLTAGRCDRLFNYGQAITVDIITNILKGLYCSKIEILEPHSGRSIDEKCNIFGVTNYMLKEVNIKFPCNIALPDRGALDRTLDLIRNWKDRGIIVCSKVRDSKTNKLSGFKVENTMNYVEGRPIYLVDDLCDGGGTFLGLAEKLRELNPESLNLMVTHAIQPEGLAKVSKAYDKVYITNSFNDWDLILPNEENIEVINVLKI